MTPAFVQGNTAYSNTTSGNNWPCAFSGAVTSGNLLIVAWSWAAVDTTGFSVTDSVGSMTWHQVFATLPSAGSPMNTSAGIAWAIVDATTAGTTPTVTVHTSGSSHARIRVLVHEYSGVDTLDASSSSTGTSTTVSSGNMTTTHANELIFGWLLSNSGVTTAGTGFTLRETAGSESTEDQNQASTGTYAATAPTSNSAWLGLGATFYSSGGGATNATVTATAGASRGRVGTLSIEVDETVTSISAASRGRTGVASVSTGSNATVTATAGSSRGRTGSATATVTATVTATSAASRGRIVAASFRVDETVSATSAVSRGRTGVASVSSGSNATVIATAGSSRGRTGTASATVTATVTAVSAVSRGRLAASGSIAIDVAGTAGVGRGRAGTGANVSLSGPTNATVSATAGVSRGRIGNPFAAIGVPPSTHPPLGGVFNGGGSGGSTNNQSSGGTVEFGERGGLVTKRVEGGSVNSNPTGGILIKATRGGDVILPVEGGTVE